ncbi:MAG: replication initiator protein [Microvirus sp.]|nr:MAG: replication initiator protein [Microvirus sp.]
MACYHPIRAVLVQTPAGKHLDFRPSASGKGLSLPCGRCIGCRVERARQWSVRIMHEAKLHDENSFLTLTYENEPSGGTLLKAHLRDFFKRLRSRLEPIRIRYYAVGEYGKICMVCGNGKKSCSCRSPAFKVGRPHYHVCLFGFSFPDKVLFKRSGDLFLYTSQLLHDTWSYGHASIGGLSHDSANYVAGYVTEKYDNLKAVQEYGERVRPFSVMSRRPGVGYEWFKKFSGDVFPVDEVLVNGVSTKPPRYYDKLAEGLQIDLTSVKDRREKAADKLEEYVTASGVRINVSPNRNAHRLRVKKVIAEAKLALKSRDGELKC